MFTKLRFLSFSKMNEIITATFLGLGTLAVQADLARGVVYHDQNRNGQRDQGEPGVSGVQVSNQLEISTTDEEGRWELPSDEDVTFFVIKPRDWMTPVNAHQLPRFFYTHKPAGSPDQSFPGIAPTGPLPSSIDFPLIQAQEPEKFEAVFFGDPQ
ncbi:metallophosphoesterase, partial [Verrucomicrobia bacterium]|nr:metallophosphoesterase [Verrucomicrobiota bacterium]